MPPEHQLLTVAIPAYNALEYLPECIDSLRRQTVSRFKLLVLDDGSTDGTHEYLQELQWPGMRFISQPNQGLTSSLNRLLREVDTPWMVRQDADDVSFPERIESILAAINLAPSAYMVHSAARYYPPTSVGTFQASTFEPEQARKVVRDGWLLSICHPSVALRILPILQLGGYRDLPHVEDVDLWWRIALQGNIHFIDRVLIGYRQRFSSVSSQHLRAQTLRLLYVQYLLLSDLRRRRPRPYEEVREALETLVSEEDLRSRKYLRDFNIYLGQRSRLRACVAMARAVGESPAFIFRRVASEWRHKNVLNGVNPKQYNKIASNLWPDGI